jgi:arylsulfatase A-like enzyme
MSRFCLKKARPASQGRPIERLLRPSQATLLWLARRTIGLACLALAAAGCDRQATPSSPSPNILIVTIDTLRADRLGSYGSPRPLTPFLDALAKRGVLFSKAYAASSWTCPSVASLMTSRYPSQHQVVSFASPLQQEEVTLAEKLQARRYRAGGFSANFRLLKELGYAQGFDHWWAEPTETTSARGADLRRRALDWLDGGKRDSPDQPVLLYMQYMEPHSPYEPPEPYRGRFRTGTLDKAREAAAAEKLAALRWYALDSEEVSLLESLYDGEVAAVDEELRLLFAELERRGFLDDAIVVVTSDHGEEFWEHGFLLHGFTLFEEGVRVPLLVLGPGIPAGLRVDQPVSLVDLAPTLLDLVGLEAEPRHEGRSLLALMREAADKTMQPTSDAAGAGNERVDVLLELQPIDTSTHSREHQAGIIRGSEKVLLRTAGRPEAYDLANDPRERHANPSGFEEAAQNLEKALEAWEADLQTRAAPSAAPAILDEATKEKLRALGYHF